MEYAGLLERQRVFLGNGDRLKQFALTSGRLSPTPIAMGPVGSGFPGVSPVISSNGTSEGVLWAVRTDSYTSGGPAILYAYSATNVGTQLYNSTQNASRDAPGKAVKFVVPVITNGKVYVGPQSEVDVYGLLATSEPTVPIPALKPAPGVYASGQSVSLSDALSSTAIYYTTNGTPPTTASLRYTGPFTVSATSTVQALGAAPGYNTSGVVSGTYTIGHCAHHRLQQRVRLGAGIDPQRQRRQYGRQPVAAHHGRQCASRQRVLELTGERAKLRHRLHVPAVRFRTDR